MAAIKILYNASVVGKHKTGYATIISDYLHVICDRQDIRVYVIVQSCALGLIDPRGTLRNSNTIEFILVPNFSSALLRVLFDQLCVNYYALKICVDVIHSPTTIGVAFPIKPQVLFFHASTTFVLPRRMHGRGRLSTWLSNLLIKQSVRHARVLLVTTEATRKELASFVKLPSATKVIYNLLPEFEVASSSRVMRPQVEALRTQKYFFYASSYYPLKNHLFLAQAFASFRQRSGESIALVIGGSVVVSDYYDALRKLESPPNIYVFDKLSADELSFLYAHCYGYISPSLFEGFSLTPMEALSFAKPILLSDIAVHHEVYGEGLRYFDPSSPESLLAATEFGSDYVDFCKSRFIELKAKYNASAFLRENIEAYYIAYRGG